MQQPRALQQRRDHVRIGELRVRAAVVDEGAFRVGVDHHHRGGGIGGIIASDAGGVYPMPLQLADHEVAEAVPPDAANDARGNAQLAEGDAGIRRASAGVQLHPGHQRQLPPLGVLVDRLPHDISDQHSHADHVRHRIAP